MIGEHAFENCLSLNSADLTSLGKLCTIDNYVFNDCINLEKVILPNSINKIGYYAFQNTIYFKSNNICSLIFNCHSLFFIA